jgi:hypothetical protein
MEQEIIKIMNQFIYEKSIKELLKEYKCASPLRRFEIYKILNKKGMSNLIRGLRLN